MERLLYFATCHSTSTRLKVSIGHGRVGEVFGSSRSNTKTLNFSSANLERRLHLQLRTLVSAVPSLRRKWKAAAQKFIVLGAPMTADGRSRPVTKSSSPPQAGRSGPRRPALVSPPSAPISWISSGCLSKRQPPCPALSAIRSKCSRHSLKNQNISSSGKLSAAVHAVAK